MKRKFACLPVSLLLLFATFLISIRGYSMSEPVFHSNGKEILISAKRRASGLLPQTGIFNVKKYGAEGDGKTTDTRAVNDAIEAAAAAGGGMVYFPAGTYISGSIHLKSHITLYLAQGCILEASGNPADYDKPENNPYDAYQDFGHSHWQNSLIWGTGLEDITIEGPGRIDGKGLVRGTPKGKTEGLGDKTIALKNCHHVVLKDFSISEGGHFGILATGVDNLTIDNLFIDTNRDGMDIDCCKNVRITNCSVNSPWDDAICLKSSYALGYAKPTEDVTITNCMVTGGYQEGTLLDGTFRPIGSASEKPTGRIKLGTESNGGFKNITISNCVFTHCRGLALETVDGGDLEDITISNITMRDIVNAPLFIRLGSRMRGPEGVPVGHLRRVNISNIVVYNAGSETGAVISGIPGHPVEDVSVSNMQIVYKGGGTLQDRKISPPEKEDGYPEPDMFGKLPAYGFYIRHTSGITFDNIRLSYAKKEERPPFVLDDVKGAQFRFIKASHEKNSPLFILKHVADIHLFHTGAYTEKQIAKAVKGNL